MTGRELYKEWVGKRADSPVPYYVKERLLEAAEHKCQGPCHQPVGPGNLFDVDHIVELVDWLGEGHGNRESNLQILCRRICHKRKTRLRAIARAQERRTRQHLNGHKVSRRPMPGSKASPWARRYNRETGQWETVKR